VGIGMGYIKKTFFNYLPKSLKSNSMRESLVLKSNLDKDLIFKVAEGKEEVEEALKLVHKSYKRVHLTKQNTYGLRITKFHLLPTTKILIAKYRGKVIATVSLVQDSQIGLPLEDIFNINTLRRGKRRFLEISSLAINPNFSQIGGIKTIFPLIKYLFFYAKKLKIDDLLCITHPRTESFYEGFLGFKLFDKDIKSVDKVLGAEGIIQHLDISNFMGNLEKLYSKTKNPHNLFNFFQREDNRNFIFRGNKFLPVSEISISDPHDFFNLFIQGKDSFLQDLTLKDLVHLKNVYSLTGFNEIIDNLPLYKQQFDRLEKRFNVNLEAKILETNETIKVWDISGSGLRISSTQRFFSPEEVINIQIWTENSGSIFIKAKVRNVLKDQCSAIGLHIEDKDPIWDNLIYSMKESMLAA
jgi:hypothetical protein